MSFVSIFGPPGAGLGEAADALRARFPGELAGDGLAAPDGTGLAAPDGAGLATPDGTGLATPDGSVGPGEAVPAPAVRAAGELRTVFGAPLAAGPGEPREAPLESGAGLVRAIVIEKPPRAGSGISPMSGTR